MMVANKNYPIKDEKIPEKSCYSSKDVKEERLIGLSHLFLGFRP